jgi:hypothetical protein
MPNESHNQAVVNWAKQNVPQPVEIRLLGGKGARALMYVLLFSVPFLIVSCQSFVKLSGFAKDVSWWGIFLLGFVLLIPAGIIVLLGARTRQTLVKSLDADGVISSLGRRFRWENLSHVDHVSKTTREGGVTRKIEDNQLELVFSNGKVIIPPLIHDRERVWALINSMPVEVRDDGHVRAAPPPPGSGAAPSFDDIVKTLGEMKAQHDRSK